MNCPRCQFCRRNPRTNLAETQSPGCASQPTHQLQASKGNTVEENGGYVVLNIHRLAGKQFGGPVVSGGDVTRHAPNPTPFYSRLVESWTDI